MRTLKKTLALVLVLAMMFSLCITASAVDYADAEDIENGLAVDTLTALGVIEGMPDGTFDPEGTLTRAQAAKIICYLLGVGEYAAEGSATDFSDVPASHWASGYIAYCAAEGIIDGMGDGTFAPSATLTGYQWSKMLLCALGYNSAVEGLTGSAWQVNSAKLAVQNGIWTGAKLDNKAGISRDDACLYAYNTLKALTVGYAIDEAFPGLSVGAQYRGDSLINTLGYEFGTEIARDAYARPEKGIYKLVSLDGDAKKDIVAQTNILEPIFSATAATKIADVEKSIKDADKEAVITVKPAVDSENGDVLTAYDLTAYGYDYEIHNVKTYACELAAGDIVEANAKKQVKAGIMIAGTKYETEEEFAAGDVVLYTINAKGEFQTVKVAETYLGKVTNIDDIKSTTPSFFVNDEEKELHGDAKVTVDYIIHPIYATDYMWVVVVDDYGYVVDFNVLPDDPNPETVYYYGFLTDYEAKVGANGTDFDLIDNKDAVAAVEKLEIVTAEGEVVVYDGAFTVDENDKTNVTFVGAQFGYDAEKDNAVYGLVKYSLNEDGEVATIEIEDTASTKLSFVTGEGTMRKDGVPYPSALMTSETIAFVYTVAEDGDVTAEVFTGYLNIPGFDGYEGRYYANDETDAIKAHAALAVDSDNLTAPLWTAPTAYAYVASDVYSQSYIRGEDDAEGKPTYEFVNTYKNLYIDGEKATVQTLGQNKLINGKGYQADGLYFVTFDKDGYVDTLRAESVVNEILVKVETSYFKTGSAKGEVIYYTDADTAYYEIVEAEGKLDVIVPVAGFPEVAEDEQVKIVYVYEDTTEADKDLAQEFVYFVVEEVEAPVDPLPAAKEAAVAALEAYVDAIDANEKGYSYVSAEDLADVLNEQIEAVEACETEEEVLAIINGNKGTGRDAIKAVAKEIQAAAEALAAAKTAAIGSLADYAKDEYTVALNKALAELKADAAEAIEAAANDEEITKAVEDYEAAVDQLFVDNALAVFDPTVWEHKWGETGEEFEANWPDQAEPYCAGDVEITAEVLTTGTDGWEVELTISCGDAEGTLIVFVEKV